MKTFIKYCNNSQTYRLMPFNYWLASVKDNKLIFDSWDGMTRKLYKKNKFLKLKVYFKFIVSQKLSNMKRQESVGVFYLLTFLIFSLLFYIAWNL